MVNRQQKESFLCSKTCTSRLLKSKYGLQEDIFLMRDQNIENNALHSHWHSAVSPNMPTLPWLKLPWTDLIKIKGVWIWFYFSSNFQCYFAKNQNIIHRNSKLAGNIRSLPIAACSLCFHDVVRNFFQLKHSQNILQLVFFYHQTICKTSWTDESKCNYSCSVKLNTNQFFQKNIYLVK